jgi:hypothetical protein
MSKLPRDLALWTALFALMLTLPRLTASAANSTDAAAISQATPTPTPTPTPAKKKSKKQKEEATPTPTATPTPDTSQKKSKKGATAESTPAGAATPAAASTPAAKGTPEKGSTKTPSKPPTAGAPSQSEIAAAQASGKVWVNLDSGVYHKGGHWYGNTKNGKFMTEAEAQKAGYREAQK